ncbi:MAG: hypothetical protein ACR2KT_09680, partial [Methylocella sp.]
SAASDQRNPIAPSHRSHWSNSKRFFESDLLAARKGYFSRCPLAATLAIGGSSPGSAHQVVVGKLKIGHPWVRERRKGRLAHIPALLKFRMTGMSRNVF